MDSFPNTNYTNELRIKRNKNFIIKTFIKFKKILKKLKKICSKNKHEFMLTPCKHLFHIECLKIWIEKKKGCPICRKDLPEYYD